MDNILIIIDNETIDKYNNYYFKLHPRATKKQIEHPWHPSINQWFVLPRIQLNNLKQKWKAFGCWIIKELGYQNLKLDNVAIEITTYFDTKRRHDVDNYVPKFLLDAFVESGLLVDDDDKHLHTILLKNKYDKDAPRTEIIIKNLNI